MAVDIEGIRARALAEAELEIKYEIMKEEVLEDLNGLGVVTFKAGPGYRHAYCAEMSVECKAADLSEAISIANRMNPLPLFMSRDGGVSFMPECPELLKKNPEKVRTVGPYIYKLDGLRQYGETKTLSFFVKAAGRIVRVDVEVISDPATYRRYYVLSRDGETVVDNRGIINNSGYFKHSLAFWSSPDISTQPIVNTRCGYPQDNSRVEPQRSHST